jgi:hypothetical protein
MEKEESGVRRTLWLSKELDRKVEEARKILGLGRSGFYRFAVVELLKSLITAKQQHSSEQT